MNFWNNLHPLLRRDKDDYGSANYAVLNTLADSLSDAETDTISKKAQLIFSTATGGYLDEWGSWFGVTRRQDESDEDYRERIKYFFLIPRSTVEGIIKGIQYYLDDSDAKISVYEPWKNIFYLNKSKLNGEDHLQGFYYRYAVIDVSIDRPMSKAVYDAIMAFKPAGVKFYTTFNPNINSKVNKLTIAELKAKRLYTIEKAYGFMYDHKLPVTFSDRPATLVNNTNYLRLNDSKLNGEDVLAGSPTHNVTYWNPLKLSYSPYRDVPVNLIVQSDLKGGYFNTDTGGIVLKGSSDFYSDNYIATNSGTVFTFSSPDYAFKGSGNDALLMYDSNKNYLGYQKITSSTQTLTKSNAAYIRFSMNFTDEGGTAGKLSDWLDSHRYKLEKDSVATPWSPNPADPEYYVSTPTQRAILSSPSNTYVSLPSSTTSMITGTLSVYNQFIANYSSLLSTYSGDTEYDRVRSLVTDPNTTVFLVVNADVPLTINGVLYPAGLSSIPVDKGSLNYTGSDINIPVSVTGTQDARVYYVYAKLKVSKDIPGLGVSIKASQNVSMIKSGPVVGTAVVGTAVLGQETTINNAK